MNFKTAIQCTTILGLIGISISCCHDISRKQVISDTNKKAIQQSLHGNDEKISLPLDQETAIRLAGKAARKGLYIPENVMPVVKERDRIFIITWPTTLQKGFRGGDFYAQVHINRDTGKIAKQLAGS